MKKITIKFSFKKFNGNIKKYLDDFTFFFSSSSSLRNMYTFFIYIPPNKEKNITNFSKKNWLEFTTDTFNYKSKSCFEIQLIHIDWLDSISWFFLKLSKSKNKYNKLFGKKSVFNLKERINYYSYESIFKRREINLSKVERLPFYTFLEKSDYTKFSTIFFITIVDLIKYNKTFLFSKKLQISNIKYKKQRYNVQILYQIPTKFKGNCFKLRLFKFLRPQKEMIFTTKLSGGWSYIFIYLYEKFIYSILEYFSIFLFKMKCFFLHSKKNKPLIYNKLTNSMQKSNVFKIEKFYE